MHVTCYCDAMFISYFLIFLFCISTDLATIVMPLRMFFLRDIVAYVEAAIRPGLEWLVKLLLAITVMSKNAKSVNEDEVRALFHLINRSIGIVRPRYAHYISFKRSDHRSVSGGMVRQNARVGGFENNHDDDGDEDGEHNPFERNPLVLARDLPASASMNHRKTAFRVGINEHLPSFRSTDGAQIVFDERVDESDDGTASRWMIKGPGELDGLWLDRRYGSATRGTTT
jgi:hypothetical protein